MEIEEMDELLARANRIYILAEERNLHPTATYRAIWNLLRECVAEDVFMYIPSSGVPYQNMALIDVHSWLAQVDNYLRSTIFLRQVK